MWLHGMIVVVVWRMWIPCITSIGLTSARSFPDPFYKVTLILMDYNFYCPSYLHRKFDHFGMAVVNTA